MSSSVSTQKKEREKKHRNLQVNIRRSRREIARSSQNKRHMDIPPQAPGILARKEPRSKRRNGAQEPEPPQPIVHGSRTKHSACANGAPDDAGCIKDLLVGASVLVGLVVGTWMSVVSM